jgi:soluble lytic murein transglycosylase-like protein
MPTTQSAAITAAGSQYLRSLQSAIDQARRLGRPLSPPVIGRSDVASPNSMSPGSAPRRTAGGGTTTSQFDDLIRAAAAREGVDPTLVKAVVQAESGFDPRAVSGAGAKGLMQLMDGTARSLGVTNSLDPVQNVVGGTKYLKQLISRYGGDVSRALAAYNAGPGAVDAYGGVPPYAETRNYVQRVLQLRDQNRSDDTRSTR